MPFHATILPAVARGVGSLFRSRGAIAAGSALPTLGRVIRNPGVQGAAGVGVGSVLFGGRGNGDMMPRRRRAKGITASELRGARKIAQLVRMYGMKPKSGRIGPKRKCR